VQDATCKNKLYLNGQSVEWFLVKDFEPLFQCNKSPLDGHPEARLSKIEQLLCILWSVPWRELVQMISGFPEGEDSWPTSITCISKVEFTIR
jgi:hypothetical protein